MSRYPIEPGCGCADCEAALDATINEAARIAVTKLPEGADELAVAARARIHTEFMLGTLALPSRAIH